MFSGITSIIYKELRHILRDPKTLMLALLIPASDMTMFGYAIDLEVSDVPTVVHNLDRRPPSRELLEKFAASGSFRLLGDVAGPEALERAIVEGEAQVGVLIPPNYSGDLLAGRQASVQVLIDGSDSTVAMQTLQAVNAIALRESLDLVSRRVGGEAAMPVQSRVQVLFNPAMKTPNFMIPALVAMVLQLVTTTLTALAIVREREQGTLEQLMVTPVSRLGLMLGKLVPYAVIGAAECVLTLGIMLFLFRVPIAGDIGLLAALAAPFVVSTLGVGLLISTVAQNQIQAAQLAFVFLLPAVLLSGFMFPIESMPLPIYWAAHTIPATYFVQVLRGVVLRGAGIAELWPQALVLTGLAVGLTLLAASRFHKQAA